MKRAPTVRLTVIVTLHVPLPVQALTQALNACPGWVDGVSVTIAPRLNWAVHPVAAATPAVILQLIPAGLEVTTPVPVPPAPFTVKVLRTTTAAAEDAGAVGSGASPHAWRMVSEPMKASRTAGAEKKRGERIRHLIHEGGVGQDSMG